MDETNPYGTVSRGRRLSLIGVLTLFANTRELLAIKPDTHSKAPEEEELRRCCQRGVWEKRSENHHIFFTLSFFCLPASELRRYLGGIGRVSERRWGPDGVWTRNRWVREGPPSTVPVKYLYFTVPVTLKVHIETATSVDVVPKQDYDDNSYKNTKLHWIRVLEWGRGGQLHQVGGSGLVTSDEGLAESD